MKTHLLFIDQGSVHCIRGLGLGFTRVSKSAHVKKNLSGTRIEKKKNLSGTRTTHAHKFNQPSMSSTKCVYCEEKWFDDHESLVAHGKLNHGPVFTSNEEYIQKCVDYTKELEYLMSDPFVSAPGDSLKNPLVSTATNKQGDGEVVHLMTDLSVSKTNELEYLMSDPFSSTTTTPNDGAMAHLFTNPF